MPASHLPCCIGDCCRTSHDVHGCRTCCLPVCLPISVPAPGPGHGPGSGTYQGTQVSIPYPISGSIARFNTKSTTYTPHAAFDADLVPLGGSRYCLLSPSPYYLLQRFHYRRVSSLLWLFSLCLPLERNHWQIVHGADANEVVNGTIHSRADSFLLSQNQTNNKTTR